MNLEISLVYISHLFLFEPYIHIIITYFRIEYGWGFHLLTNENVNQHAQDILSKLDEQKKQSISVQEVAEELEKFLEYGVPVKQAKQTLLKKFGVNTPLSAGNVDRTLLADLNPNMRNVKLVVQVVSINPKDIMVKNQPRTIFTGLLRDESGTLPFTAWDKPAINEGDIVEINNAYTKEWLGKTQLNLGNQVSFEKKEKDALPKETFEPKKVTIAEINPLVGTIELTARVLSIEEKEITVDDQKKILYTGVLGDSTAKIPFTAWTDFGIKKDKTIHINGGYVKSFRGMPQVNLDENATVKIQKNKIAEDDIPSRSLQLYELNENAGMYDVEVSGRIIEIQQGSGLILRCPECNQVLSEDGCRVHGAVEGMVDLRLKCIVDDGTGSVKTILNKEKTEQILGKTLDECKQMNPEELQSAFFNSFFGKKITMKGNALQDNFGTTFLADTLTVNTVDADKEAERVRELLEELS